MFQAIQDLATRIAGTGVSEFIAATEGVIPAMQTIHIVALAIVFTSGAFLSLSAFGLPRIGWHPLQWHARVRHWMSACLVVLLLSGTVLVVGEPERSLANPIFQLKMVLLVAVLVLGAVNVSRLRRMATAEGTALPTVDGGTRLLGLVTLSIWIAIVVAGRWIAYFVN